MIAFTPSVDAKWQLARAGTTEPWYLQYATEILHDNDLYTLSVQITVDKSGDVDVYSFQPMLAEVVMSWPIVTQEEYRTWKADMIKQELDLVSQLRNDIEYKGTHYILQVEHWVHEPYAIAMAGIRRFQAMLELGIINLHA